MSDPMINNLSQNAKMLVQARMLPMAKKLTDEQVKSVRSDYVIYVKTHGIFDAQVAKETGVSTSAISQWKSDQYKGDVEKLTRNINDWMEHNARKRKAHMSSDYVSTIVAEEMQAVVNVACTSCSMVAIVAPSGSGKSMVMEILCDKYRGNLIYCTEDLTARAFLAKVAKAIGIRYSCRNRSELMDAIIDKLAGTHRPIFLDEAHRLPKEALPRIRTIYDLANVPIIMAGTHVIIQNINDRSEGRGQFASRCLQYNVMEHVLNAESPESNRTGRPLFSHSEIKRFIDNLQVKFHDSAFQLAWAVACLPNHGCLRTLKRVIMLLRPNSDNRSKPITRKEILQALPMMFGEQGRRISKSADTHIETTRRLA